MKRILISTAVFALFFVLLIVLVKQISQNTSSPSVKKVSTNGSVTDCFDYYKFQSVQVSAGTEKDSYGAGEVVKFNGSLINQNDYPVIDGYIFVRVSRYNDNYLKEGHYVVDEFFAKNKVALDANEEREVQFDWSVPEGLSAGTYKADFFFSVGKKFNLGGLPFTNEIIVGGDDFEIISDNVSYVSFKRDETQINGKSYKHIGNWPLMKPHKEVSVIQPIENTADVDKGVLVTYQLYYWDSLDQTDLADQRTETIVIPANSTEKLAYVIPDMNESVYYLKITAASENQKSIVNIRMASDQERPRMNYPAITSFPLKKDEVFTLFSCFHNTSALDTLGKIEVSLFGRGGNKIDDLSYEGKITSSMMAAKKDLQAKENLDYLKLKTQLYDKNGKRVDEYEVTYDCKQLESCQSEKALVSSLASSSSITLILIASFALILIFIVWILLRKPKSEQF